jgi:toxin-antitoxin system PIN domain toxin
MIAVDTNILVYAHRVDSPFHEPAHESLSNLAAGPGSWAIPWPCIPEFLAVVTHPRIFRTPTPVAGACDQVEAWLESPSLQLLGEDREVYWPIARRAIAAGHVTGPRIHDARIAALCLTHGVSELLTADRDFSRFRDLTTRNPLV